MPLSGRLWVAAEMAVRVAGEKGAGGMTSSTFFFLILPILLIDAIGEKKKEGEKEDFRVDGWTEERYGFPSHLI